MSKTCFLLGGDERQRWAAQALLAGSYLARFIRRPLFR